MKKEIVFSLLVTNVIILTLIFDCFSIYKFFVFRISIDEYDWYDWTTYSRSYFYRWNLFERENFIIWSDRWDVEWIVREILKGWKEYQLGNNMARAPWGDAWSSTTKFRRHAIRALRISGGKRVNPRGWFSGPGKKFETREATIITELPRLSYYYSTLLPFYLRIPESVACQIWKTKINRL